MSGIDFYVQALNSEITSLFADITPAQEGSFTADVVAVCNLPKSVAQNAFRFQTDAIDLENAAATDILYKVDYAQDTNMVDGVPMTVLGTDWLASSECVATDNDDAVFLGGTVNAAKKQVAHDYVRFTAYKLFNTWLGVDLFNNEEELVTAINTRGRTSLDNTLTALAALNESAYCQTGTTYNTFSHPSESILSSIIQNAPERLAQLNNYLISGDQSGADPADPSAPIFKMPLEIGDTIQFKLTVKAAASQETVTGVSPIGDRYYRIKFAIVADSQ